MNPFLRLARAVLDTVLSQLTQQQNIVQDMALKPIDAMVQQVMGGIWIGKGADAFVQEAKSLVIPGIKASQTNITKMNSNLVFARERIIRADQEVDRLIKNRIFDAFKFF